MSWGRAHVRYWCVRIRIVSCRWCSGKKRSRTVRSMVGRVTWVALSKHRMGVSLLRGSWLVDYSGAHWLLMASAASEATFAEVALVDGMSS